MRDFVKKLESGEYISTWKGFSPYWLGTTFGNTNIQLGGEEKFKQCTGWFSGIGDVEWWIVEELNKLSREESDELINILYRNRSVKEMLLTYEVIEFIADALSVEKCVIYRIPDKYKLRLIRFSSIEELKERYDEIQSYMEESKKLEQEEYKQKQHDKYYFMNEATMEHYLDMLDTASPFGYEKKLEIDKDGQIRTDQREV